MHGSLLSEIMERSLIQVCGGRTVQCFACWVGLYVGDVYLTRSKSGLRRPTPEGYYKRHAVSGPRYEIIRPRVAKKMANQQSLSCLKEVAVWLVQAWVSQRKTSSVNSFQPFGISPTELRRVNRFQPDYCTDLSLKLPSSVSSRRVLSDES